MSGQSVTLTELSIKALGQIITGDGGKTPYRSGPSLVAFFNQFGANDEYGQGFPSRWVFAEAKLRQQNGTSRIVEIVEAALDPRLFLGSEHLEEAAVNFLNGYLRFDGLQIEKVGLLNKVSLTAPDLVEMRSGSRPSDDLTREFIAEQMEKCRKKLAGRDFDGSITNARALLEAVLGSIERSLSAGEVPSDGDLVKQYRRVQVLLNLDPSRTDIGMPLKQVLQGLASAVSGIAGMRNAMSDAHARRYRPDEHHARLAVNAATTVSDFLFETFEYQRRRGAIFTEGDNARQR